MIELTQVTRLLRDLFASQQLAVIATQGSGQPHSSLVAFAETDDLKQLLFVTNRDTRKYANLKGDGRAAMLVDGRTNHIYDVQTAIAVKAIGIADEVSGSDKDRLSQMYLTKHPHLADFVNESKNALVRVKVREYVIAKFGEVTTVPVQG
jgi:nitroimidazol reductase NimA-like FMN-containing flavoprotein (pyridoxamine 5'-phosphate oxidase superfamily)